MNFKYHHYFKAVLLFQLVILQYTIGLGQNSFNNYELQKCFSSLDKSRINEIFKYGTNLWLLGEKGLVKSDVYNLKSEKFLYNKPVMSITLDNDNSIWVGTYYSSILKIENDKVKEINLKESFEEDSPQKDFIVNEIISSINFLYLVGDNQKLYRFNKISETSKHLDIDEHINTFDLVGNEKWIGTTRGLIISKEFSNDTKDVKFSNSEILKLLRLNGEVYVVGVKNEKNFIYKYHIKKRKWKKISLFKRFSKSRIRDIDLFTFNQPYLASQFLFRQDEKGKWKTVSNINNKPLLCLQADTQRDRIFIGTEGDGVYLYGKTVEENVDSPKNDAEKGNENTFQGKEVKENVSIEIQNLLFTIDDSTLTEISYETLDELFNFMSINDKYELVVEGHTSTGDSKKRLLKLSLGRARAVKNYLTSKGIDGKRVFVKGHGDNKLKDKRKPRSDINKRVEITFIKN